MRAKGSPNRPYTRRLEDLEKSDFIAAIRLVPDLDVIAFAASVARAVGLQYPLRSQTDLRQLFRGRTRLRFESHSFSWEQVCKYFREEFFPVENEDHLLAVAQVALAIRRQEFAEPKHRPQKIEKSRRKHNG